MTDGIPVSRTVRRVHGFVVGRPSVVAAGLCRFCSCSCWSIGGIPVSQAVRRVHGFAVGRQNMLFVVVAVCVVVVVVVVAVVVV